MATPVGNLTVDEAHTEFSKLIDQITAIDEKLKLGEFGEATSAPFIAKVQELASLFAHALASCVNGLTFRCQNSCGGCLTSNTEVAIFRQNLHSQSSCSFILLCKNWVDRHLAGKAPSLVRKSQKFPLHGKSQNI